jgi:hypothetical protein
MSALKAREVSMLLKACKIALRFERISLYDLGFEISSCSTIK